MCKEKSCVVSVRIPEGVLDEIDRFVENSPVKISRSAAIVYLITKGLIFERCSDIDNGKANLVERDLIDD